MAWPLDCGARLVYVRKGRNMWHPTVNRTNMWANCMVCASPLRSFLPFSHGRLCPDFLLEGL